MDTLGDIISMGCTLFDLAHNAKMNKALCQQLASLVQATGMNLTRVTRLYASLMGSDNELQEFLCEFMSILDSIYELVDKASKMGRLRRYLTVVSVEDDFREAHLSMNRAITSKNMQISCLWPLKIG